MFKITNSSGFHITFENGYTFSAQWSPGCYCDYYDSLILIGDGVTQQCGRLGSYEVEIGIISPVTKKLIEFPGTLGNHVKGYCSSNEVLKWMNYCSKLNAEDEINVKKN